MESRSNLYIVRALSKYGMSNFSLYILEYTPGGGGGGGGEENLITCPTDKNE